MTQTQTASSDVVLEYAVRTDPSPLEASPASGPPTSAWIEFEVSCPPETGQATVASIAFNLPVGDPSAPDSSDLAQNKNIGPSVSSSGPDLWQVDTGLSDGSFIVRPAAGQSGVIAGQTLTVTFTGIVVSAVVGTAEVGIVEQTDQPDQPRQTTIEVAKFPQGFYASDFTATTPLIDPGKSATLTWSGSDNATFTLMYQDQTVDVTNVRSWASPQLYETTTFTLRAKASVGGETVELDATTTVDVAAPDIVMYQFSPDVIDYNQTVDLVWRSVCATGVYLLIGESSKVTLGPEPTGDPRERLQPQYDVEYRLQAFRTASDGSEILSPVYSLAITFNPLNISTFTADPAVVDADHPTTQIAWNVEHAQAVTFKGKTVSASGTSMERPTDNTRFELAATWVDGTVTTKELTVPVNCVRIERCWIVGVTLGNGEIGAVLMFTVDNATSGVVSGARLVVEFNGSSYQTSDTTASVDHPGASKWWCSLKWDAANESPIFRNTTDFSGAQVSVHFDYAFDGFLPVSVTGVQLDYAGTAAV